MDVWTNVTRVWDAVIAMIQQRELSLMAGCLRLTGSQMGRDNSYSDRRVDGTRIS